MYNIIEVANTHGGRLRYINSVIDVFSDYKGYGIKFQPFRYDQMATPDFEYYEVYKKLYFNPVEWRSIINRAVQKSYDVWLDLFDNYSIEILKDNLALVKGMKLQASVLYNRKLIESLSEIDLDGKKLMLNFAGYETNVISNILEDLKLKLNPSEIIIQVGIQSYPTQIGDSGLGKITKLKEVFPGHSFAFADHIAGNSNDAIYVPVLAAISGYKIIEKHVMLDESTEYDHLSSLTPQRYKEYIETLQRFLQLKTTLFITPKEKEYLQSTFQIPITSKALFAGDLVNLKDLEFKRSGKKGLSIVDLEALVSEFYVVKEGVKENCPMDTGDLRPAKIGAIIACRMKSSRLKEKALCKIGTISSVELAIRNTLKLRNVDSVTLATSYLEQDAVLEKYTYSKKVNFFKGHPDDVILRFLDVAIQEALDIIVRQTADNPFISDDILQVLLKSHFATGADYTACTNAALGTGLEIINTKALLKVREYFPFAEYSEYMTWYFQNNPDYFNLNLVTLPESLSRHYRLTLDYPEDLQMFNELVSKSTKGIDVTLPEIFEILDSEPGLANMNKNCAVKYQSDDNLISLLNKKTKIPVT